MHRLVNFKLKKKPPQDGHRSADQEAAVNQSPSILPVLELSLSDAKSFRASVILPDLSRRFTLLRRNGELLPINNFCEHVRHELEIGQITEEDENILIRHYQQQYFSEAPLYSSCPPTSTSESNTPPLSPPAPRVTSKAPNLLFSGGSAARDAAYIHKTMRMSNNQKKPNATLSNDHAAHGLVEQPDSVSTLDDISENSTLPTPVDDQTIVPLSQVIGTLQSESENENWEDHTSIELTRTQMQRLSLAVDRILGSHHAENPRASNLELESVPLQDHPHPSPSHSLSTPLDAESRVREELSRALPEEISPTALAPSSSWSDVQADNDIYHGTPSVTNQPPQHDDHISHTPSDDHGFQTQYLKDNSMVDPALSEEFSIESHHDGLEPDTILGRESSVFGSEPFEFNDLPPLAPTFDRNRPLPSVDWTYDDALFLQRTLCNSHDFQSQQHPSPLSDLTYDDVLFIQTALCSPHPHQSQQPVRYEATAQLERNLSVSTCPSSTVGSPDTPSSAMSPRSSSLHHRLNLAKSFVKDSSRKAAPFQPSSNNVHPPPETLLGAPPSLFDQMLSPSSADRYDVGSFPPIPPIGTRSSLVGQACIPSSLSDSNLSPNETREALPRGFNSRAGRPIPTTILFRDVEAQMVAANATLRLISTAQTDGPAPTRKLYPRKKSVSTAQVGAPKLLSASAKLSELELGSTGTERIDLDRSTSHTEAKDASKKTIFNMRLRKKRPSESRSSHDNNDFTLDVTHKLPDSSQLIQVEETALTPPPTSTAFAQTKDVINASPIQSSKHFSADPPESHASWKHPHALTTRVRRLMSRQRKMTSNPVPVSKHHTGPSSSVYSNDTSAAVPLVDQASRRRTAEHAQELELEGEDMSSVWPPSGSKSPCHSQSFNEMGLSSSETPSRDNDLEDHHNSNSLFVSVVSADRPYPEGAESELHRPWSERRSLAISQKSKNHPHDDAHEDLSQSEVPIANSDPTKESSPIVDPLKIVVDGFKPRQNESAHSPLLSSPWPEAQESELHSANSDYASSILDLYGCGSPSTRPSSPKRSSSASCYSVPHDSSKPVPGLFLSNHLQPPQRLSNGHRADEEGGKALSANELHPTPRHVVPGPRDSSQNELMVMVQQLQNSTRYSEFEPTRSSFNPGLDSSPASFIQHIVKTQPDGNSVRKIDPLPQHAFVDDDDEAEVWKQILQG